MPHINNVSQNSVNLQKLSENHGSHFEFSLGVIVIYRLQVRQCYIGTSYSGIVLSLD